MIRLFHARSLSFLAALACALPAHAAAAPRTEASPSAADAEYWRVVTGRAEKILAPLGLEDAAQRARVRDLIAQHYVDLNDLHGRRDAALKALDEDGDPAAAVRDAFTRKQYALHVTFVARLAAELTAEQVNQVKDGLTYGVLPITYRHYQELYPELTDEQKRRILAWLIEAREYAMDGGSSEEKHAWFGEYKGRINNYLSAAGYDAKAAEKALAERRKRQ